MDASTQGGWKADPRAEASKALFQELKPCCIEISQLAIRQPDNADAARKLRQLTQQLYGILERATNQPANALNAKLAEYVFFPLSHIFRQLDQFPKILVETCLGCLRLLISHGWQHELSAELAQQLVSLLTVVIDGKPGSDEENDIPEETILEGFKTLAALFGVIRTAPRAATCLVDTAFVPTTGHIVSVTLDALADSPNVEIQLEAAEALRNVWATFREQTAFEAFLPGTVSSLAKILSAPSKYKTSVITKCLNVLTGLLVVSLGSMRLERLKARPLSIKKDEEDQKGEESNLDSWIKATASQTKIALVPVMKLHTSESPIVRKELSTTCIRLLDECHDSLSNCAAMLVEAAIVLSDEEEQTSLMTTSLTDLVGIYPELGGLVKSSVYSWITALPRLMQANDDRTKRAMFVNLTRGVNMIRELRIESSTLEDALSTSLRDGIIALMTAAKDPSSSHSAQVQLLTDTNSQALSISSEEAPYQRALLYDDSTQTIKKAIIEFLSAAASLPRRASLTTALLDSLHESGSQSQIAAFWLLFELHKASQGSASDMDALIDISDEDDDNDEVLKELYSFSIESLSSQSQYEMDDWRLAFISMEVVSHAASISGQQFRPELIDLLFPIASFLGSDNAQLRQQAITTLNGLALSCRYASVSELLIDNVDYVINSVSLRLDSLDVSPASTAVLQMMVRLAGPKIVPFLDDVVDSIFAALENYHGYTSFVENLFSVLNDIVNQAVKTDTALLTGTDTPAPSHRKTKAPELGLQSVLDYLDRMEARRKADEEEDKIGKRPDGPFKRFVDEADEMDAAAAEGPPQEPEKPPPTPTYQLLMRIVSLTQHYLTSPTPRLRRSLLDVISVASPALGADEDSFLPLVNSIWPVVYDSLFDEERYVAIEACKALSSLCAASGDFLSSRFKTVWWESLGKWCRRVKDEANAQKKRGAFTTTRSTVSTSTKEIILPFHTAKPRGSTSSGMEAVRSDSGSLGQHASQAKLWEGVVQLLIAILSYVRIEEQIFDEVLEILVDEMEKNKEALEALETINEDAVWLARFERGRIEVGEPPQVEGMVFEDIRFSIPAGVRTDT